jgi:hypothetical protein
MLDVDLLHPQNFRTVISPSQIVPNFPVGAHPQIIDLLLPPLLSHHRAASPLPSAPPSPIDLVRYPQLHLVQVMRQRAYCSAAGSYRGRCGGVVVSLTPGRPQI